MSHLVHAFAHARRLVLSAPMLLHPPSFTIPMVPHINLVLQSGPQFVTVSYPRRYASPAAVHELRGAILIQITFSFW